MLTRLRTETEQSRKAIQAKQHELTTALGEIAELRNREQKHGARIAELEQRVSELDQRLTEQTAATEQARTEAERVRSELTAALEAQVAAEWTAPASPGADDLTAIRGIGPKFEKALIASGVRRYADIAAWTDAEIESIGRKLKVKPERIRREQWIERARELAQAHP